MRLFQPLVIRPARHLLLVRHKKEAAWLQAAGFTWVVLCWYLPAFYYRGIEHWFWWLWVSAPIVVIAALHRQVIDLIRRCGRGDEFVFDSAAGSLTHGSRTVPLRSIDKVIFRTFSGSGVREREIYSLELLLADGSKIRLTILREEKPVADLANQIADFLGTRVEKVYASAGEHASIKSLDLTQRQLDSEMDSHRRDTE